VSRLPQLPEGGFDDGWIVLTVDHYQVANGNSP
jgi:hypothetical protein